MKTEFQKNEFVADKYKIISDFQIVLDYILANKPEVSRKINRIPNDDVIELNKKLSKNLLLDLKQHNQISYPQINGLILILRASGLGIVDYINNKQILTIDESLYAQWNGLNQTEKYFNLLFAWIFNGVPTIIGVEEELTPSFEKLLHFMTTNISNFNNFMELDSETLKKFKFSVASHNFALLEMFGLIEISDNSSEISKKWNITAIKYTQLGHSVFQAIKNVLINLKIEIDYGNFLPLEMKNALQNQFKNVFGEYKTDLQIFDAIEFNPDLIFKVSLGRIWRKIAIPSDYPLNCFCDFIIDCFDFDHSHLYKVIIKNRYGYNETYMHPEMNDNYRGNPNTKDFTIKELMIKPGTTMDFIYDFGDNWQFEILCEAMDKVKHKKPRIIEKKGKSPEQYEYQ